MSADPFRSLSTASIVIGSLIILYTVIQQIVRKNGHRYGYLRSIKIELTTTALFLLLLLGLTLIILGACGLTGTF